MVARENRALQTGWPTPRVFCSVTLTLHSQHCSGRCMVVAVTWTERTLVFAEHCACSLSSLLSQTVRVGVGCCSESRQNNATGLGASNTVPNWHFVQIAREALKAASQNCCLRAPQVNKKCTTPSVSHQRVVNFSVAFRGWLSVAALPNSPKLFKAFKTSSKNFLAAEPKMLLLVQDCTQVSQFLQFSWHLVFRRIISQDSDTSNSPTSSEALWASCCPKVVVWHERYQNITPGTFLRLSRILFFQACMRGGSVQLSQRGREILPFSLFFSLQFANLPVQFTKSKPAESETWCWNTCTKRLVITALVRSARPRGKAQSRLQQNKTLWEFSHWVPTQQDDISVFDPRGGLLRSARSLQMPSPFSVQRTAGD